MIESIRRGRGALEPGGREWICNTKELSPYGSECGRGSTKSDSGRKGMIRGRRDKGVWEGVSLGEGVEGALERVSLEGSCQGDHVWGCKSLSA